MLQNIRKKQPCGQPVFIRTKQNGFHKHRCLRVTGESYKGRIIGCVRHQKVLTKRNRALNNFRKICTKALLMALCYRILYPPIFPIDMIVYGYRQTFFEGRKIIFQPAGRDLQLPAHAFNR